MNVMKCLEWNKLGWELAVSSRSFKLEELHTVAATTGTCPVPFLSSLTEPRFIFWVQYTHVPSSCQENAKFSGFVTFNISDVADLCHDT